MGWLLLIGSCDGCGPEELWCPLATRNLEGGGGMKFELLAVWW
jgi:hypothetical protein